MSFRKTSIAWLAFSLMLLSAAAMAQNTRPPRQRSPLDATNWGVVYDVPANAVNEGFTNRNAYETDEDLAPLRAETRFQELLARLPKS